VRIVVSQVTRDLTWTPSISRKRSETLGSDRYASLLKVGELANARTPSASIGGERRVIVPRLGDREPTYWLDLKQSPRAARETWPGQLDLVDEPAGESPSESSTPWSASSEASGEGDTTSA
jgi:hypothetical protein